MHGVIYWSMACRTGPQHMGVASRLPHVLFGDTPEAARSASTSNQTPGLPGALIYDYSSMLLLIHGYMHV